MRVLHETDAALPCTDARSYDYLDTPQTAGRFT